MALTNYGKNKALDALGVTQLSLHYGDPGSTGANEVTGGTYARQSMTMNVAANGSAAMASQLTFNIPAGTTVTHYAIWDGSAVLDSGMVSNSTTFNDAGTYLVTAATIDLNK